MAFMASKTGMCTMAIARLDRPGPTCSPKTRLSPGGTGVWSRPLASMAISFQWRSRSMAPAPGRRCCPRSRRFDRAPKRGPKTSPKPPGNPSAPARPGRPRASVPNRNARRVGRLIMALSSPSSHLGPGLSEREQPACQICGSGGDRNLREFGPAQALECRAQRHRVTPVGHSTPHDAILENDHGDKARKRRGGAVALLEVAVSEIREQPAAGDHARPQDEREPAREPRRERRPCARVPLADQAERPQVEEPGVEPGRDE